MAATLRPPSRNTTETSGRKCGGEHRANEIETTDTLLKNLRASVKARGGSSQLQDLLDQLTRQMTLPDNEARMVVEAIAALNRDMLDS